MPAPGPWTLCYTPPGGVRSCSYIPLVAEWPDLTDHPDPVILDEIGRLQGLAGEVTEPLPAGFEFLREATHDRPYSIRPRPAARSTRRPER